ncbi:MAG: hypothetical protein QOC71_26 [Thermoplasmata archaeon]|nr:hypothetical protein [Thermoplasmata archaeon]
MDRFAALALAALVALPLAGCLSADPNTEGSGATPTTETATGLASTSPPVVDVDAFLAEFNEVTAKYGDRANNGPEHEGARQYFADEFAKLGLQVWRHDFTDGIPQANIVGIQWGAHRDQVVVVGGHYDTFSDDCIVLETAGADCPGRQATNGVYDDGSGTMLTMYMARLFAPLATEYTIAYVMFDGEERGLQGSAAFVEAFLSGDTPFGDAALRAAIDVDMFGLNWPGVSTPVEFSHTSKAMEAAVDEARKELGVPDDMIVFGDASGGGGSDFASFVDHAPTGFFSSDMGQEGAPMVSPEQTTPPVPGVYPWWHLVDTWETMTAMAGGPANLAAGFSVGAQLEADLLWSCAVDPAFDPS